MKKITDFRRGIVRCVGLAAVAILALSAMADQRAEALTLVNPGAVPTAKYVSEGLTTEVRGGHGGGHFRGGGGGHFHGGGGGGFRAAHVFHGGPHFSGHRYGGYRVATFHRHRFHRHFYRPYYYAPSYYPYGYCRVVWTYYGPRRICGYRHHHWRYHHRRHHRFHIYW